MSASGRMAVAQAPATSASEEAALSETLAGLRAQMGELTTLVSDAVERRVTAASREMGDAVDEAARRGRESRAALEASIQDQPLAAVAVAAGVGLVLGLALRR